jgi:Raf kinase inhibitor-like YbhB/YbcL family protein
MQRLAGSHVAASAPRVAVAISAPPARTAAPRTGRSRLMTAPAALRPAAHTLSVLLAIGAFWLCLAVPTRPARAADQGFVLRSSTFAPNGRMPRSAANDRDGCGGENRSPELSWTGMPRGTKSLALTLHDPDAQAPGGWWHWVRFNVPTSIDHLVGRAGRVAAADSAGVDGTTSFGSTGYGGPCPPPGDRPHHYIFTLYALDVPRLATDATITGPQLQALVKGHVLGQATLVGRYGR